MTPNGGDGAGNPDSSSNADNPDNSDNRDNRDNRDNSDNRDQLDNSNQSVAAVNSGNAGNIDEADLADHALVAIRNLAAGDFTALTTRFAGAGCRVVAPGPGMLQITPLAPGTDAMRLLVSVGVHGDETAPIAMLAALLQRLTPAALRVELMLVVGNLAAIAAATRFVDADMNRLFSLPRGALATAADAARADLIMAASAAFLAGPATQRWHLDLHSAIRPSHHARFALLPSGGAAAAERAALVAWLGSAAIDAVVFNDLPAPTFSAWSARTCGAISATLELGQVAVLGQHSQAPLRRTSAALKRLLQALPLPPESAAPLNFYVAQEIVKRSAAFHMEIDADTMNFTPFGAGALIATDGALTTHAGLTTEYLVFPNPRVLVGQRAGLMLVRDDVEAGSPHGQQ